MGQFSVAFVQLLALFLAFEGAGGAVAGRSPVPVRLGAGILVICTITGILGWAGLLTPVMLWAVLGLSVASLLMNRRSPHGRGLILVLAAALVLLPLAGMPPVARDAMNHHLYLPRLWLESGAIYRPGWARFFSYPYLVELLYALTGGTIGFRAAGTVSLAGFLCSLAALVEGGGERRRGDGILAALILLSIPEAFRNATWAYADSFLVLFSVLAFVELTSGQGRPARAAVWAAAAAACKYNGLVVAAVVAAALPLRFRLSPGRLAACWGLILLLCLPWAVPNLVEHSNPVYPLLSGLFGTARELAPQSQQLIDDYGRFVSAVDGPLGYVMLPLRVSLGGRWDDPRSFDGASGPLLLAGTLLFLMLGRNRRRIVIPAAVIILSIVFMGHSIRTRYLLPGLAMLCLPAAEGLGEAFSRRGFAGIAAKVMAAVCLGWSASWLVRLYAAEKPWEAGEEDFLQSRLPYMGFYEICDSVLEDDDTTLFVNMGNRAFYFPAPVIFEESRFPIPLLDRIYRGMSADSIAADLRMSGVRYIAAEMDVSQINLSEALDDSDFAVWRDFATNRLEPVASEGPYILFRLDAEKASSTLRKSSPSSETLVKSTGMEDNASM